MKHLPLLLLLGGLLSASAARSADPVRYVDAATLTVIGKALPTEQPYNRIDTTRFRVPAKTPGYCYHPTGLAVVFRTDSRTIRARWETSGKNPSDNMAAVAQKGLDLYIRNNGEWVLRRSRQTEDQRQERPPRRRNNQQYGGGRKGVPALSAALRPAEEARNRRR